MQRVLRPSPTPEGPPGIRRALPIIYTTPPFRRASDHHPDHRVLRSARGQPSQGPCSVRTPGAPWRRVRWWREYSGHGRDAHCRGAGGDHRTHAGSFPNAAATAPWRNRPSPVAPLILFRYLRRRPLRRCQHGRSPGAHTLPADRLHRFRCGTVRARAGVAVGTTRPADRRLSYRPRGPLARPCSRQRGSGHANGRCCFPVAHGRPFALGTSASHQASPRLALGRQRSGQAVGQ